MCHFQVIWSPLFGIKIEIELKNQEFDISLPPNYFVFDANAYPNYYIND